MNLPSDTVLTPIQDDPLKDESYSCFLTLLEVDPGEDLVAQLMNRIEKIG